MTKDTGRTPERVIVLFIDGLHWKAPSLLEMPNFNSLVQSGTYIAKSYMIIPHHPTIGEYGRLHTTSFPNPVLQEGTLFIRPENRMLQEVFGTEEITGFIANTTAYTSVSRGFNINIHNPAMTDGEVMDESIRLLETNDLRYCRIHLQTSGNQGRYLSYTTPDKPYYRNIWGAGSPYMAAIETADVLLGKLIDYLKKTGKWSSSLLIVTSDHGQSSHGWHPIIDEDSYVTPLVFSGSSIAQKRQLDYFEHTDLAATIAALMGVEKPNNDGGAGRFVTEVSDGGAGNGAASAAELPHPTYIKIINRQLNLYNSLRAKMMIAAESNSYYSSLISYLENELLTPEPFYHQDRFLEWHKAGTVANLIQVNDRILKQMEKELAKL